MVKDPAWALAEHACGSGFADLPAATRAATCNDILDTFGCLLGGSGNRHRSHAFGVAAPNRVR